MIPLFAFALAAPFIIPAAAFAGILGAGFATIHTICGLMITGSTMVIVTAAEMVGGRADG